MLPHFVPAFDKSASEILARNDLWLEGLLRWDALHFERIARDGYTFEQEFAFMPALPRVMRFFGSLGGLELYAPARALLWTSILALLSSIVTVVIFHRCFYTKVMRGIPAQP